MTDKDLVIQQNSLTNDTPEVAPATVVQNAQNIINTGDVGTFSPQVTMNMPALPGMPEANSVQLPQLSNEYYSLITLADEYIKGYQGQATLRKEDCLVDKNYMEDDVRVQFSSLSEAAIARILSFPALIAVKGSDDAQYIYTGRITAVENKENGISISYLISDNVPREIILENRNSLLIKGNDSANELSHTHWAIKKLDLFSVLNQIK